MGQPIVISLPEILSGTPVFAGTRVPVQALIDYLEGGDRRRAGDIVGHDVKMVPEMGLAALKNGELLARAEDEFDAFITVDRNLPFQQDVSRFSFALIVLRAPSNRVADLRRLVPQLLTALPVAKRGEVTWVGT